MRAHVSPTSGTRCLDDGSTILPTLVAHLVEPLPRWFESYAGTGQGTVDPSCYPDPYVGDLRGGSHDVRIVILGLNPGVGYPSLQGHAGRWTERIRELGYSSCFERSPAEDPGSWKQLHGNASAYWRNAITFTRRWLHDETADVHNILNFELYPWHSNAIVGKMAPPPDLIDEFVWSPAQEVPTPAIFAFGARWFQICDALELPEAAAWGAGGDPFPGLDVDKGWRVAAYRLPSEQFAVVSSQPGYSGPPGKERVEVLRGLLSMLLEDWEMSLSGIHANAAGHSPANGSTGGDGMGAERDGQLSLPQGSRAGGRLSHYWQRGLLAMQVVSELHQRGYQRLRIVPGMSGSGFDWRCVLVPASRLSGRAGFTIDDELVHRMAWEQQDAARDRRPPPIVLWGPSDQRTILGVRDADAMTPEEIADAVAERYPHLVAASAGRDWAYAGWLLERLCARNGLFPIAYDNWDYDADFSDGLRMWGPAVVSGAVTRPLPPPVNGGSSRR